MNINSNKEGLGFNNSEKRKAKIKIIRFVNAKNGSQATLNFKQNEKQKNKNKWIENKVVKPRIQNK